MWNAIGEYADGTRIEKNFLYNEEGNYNLECERQYDLECWLIEQGKNTEAVRFIASPMWMKIRGTHASFLFAYSL